MADVLADADPGSVGGDGANLASLVAHDDVFVRARVGQPAVCEESEHGERRVIVPSHALAQILEEHVIQGG